MVNIMRKIGILFALIFPLCLLNQGCGPLESTPDTKTPEKQEPVKTDEPVTEQPVETRTEKPTKNIPPPTTEIEDTPANPADDATEEQPIKPPALGDSVSIATECANQQIIVAADLDELRNTNWSGRLFRDNADKGFDLKLTIDPNLNIKYEKGRNLWSLSLGETWQGTLNAETPEKLQFSKPGVVFGSTVEKYTVYKCDKDELILFKSDEHNGYMLFTIKK